MGNEQATRKVSFEREPTGLIAVSDSVAKRLQNAEKSAKISLSSSTPAQRTPVGSKSPPSESESQQAHGIKHTETESVSSWESRDKRFIHTPTVSQEEHADALKKLESQWQERHKILLDDMERIGQHSADEFIKASKEVDDLMASKSYAVGSTELQNAVINCYKENTTRSLKCSREAEAFINSVDNYRFAFLEKQAF